LDEFLSDRMHHVNPPAFLRQHRADYCGCNHKFGFEGYNKLQLSKIWIWPGDLRCGAEYLEVGGPGSRKEIGGGRENCRLEIKRAVIPGERELVTPHSCIVV